jgi:hypothetical protein
MTLLRHPHSLLSALLRVGAVLIIMVFPMGCGGGGGSTGSASSLLSTTINSNTGCVAVGRTSPATVTPFNQLPVAKRQAALAQALGKPQRLLVGLGAVEKTSVQKQSLLPDIFDTYIGGVGADSWPYWNSPTGEYAQMHARNADCFGSVPMFPLYQMASRGDGNMTVLYDFAFMQGYWDNVRILFNQLQIYGNSALVNVEPDFWGYAQRISTDPNKHFAHVSLVNPDCSDMKDSVASVAGCLIRMARKYAPKAYVGFPPAQFDDIAANELNYFKLLGVDKADFVVTQTLDRDIGCIEAAYTSSGANCSRPISANSLKIWDETNVTSPNFTEHFATAKSFSTGLGLPLIWWQTPMGVPSTAPGGTALSFRDNRMRYFLSHASELVNAGGVGVVFSPGHVTQTNLNTDGGQFKTLSTAYLSKPAVLP